jgi:hypothetical protein
VTYTSALLGSSRNPTSNSFASLTLATNTTLRWRSENVPDAVEVVDFMEVDASFAGLSYTMPDATKGALGVACVFYNAGANIFGIVNSTPSTLATIGVGECYAMVLKTQASAAGTWRAIPLGTGSYSATAASIDSISVLALGGVLVQNLPVSDQAAGFAIGAADRGYLFNWTGGAGTATLVAAATATAGFVVYLRNSGSGIITIDPNGAETIDDASSLAISPGDSTILVCDGDEWYTVGLTTHSTAVTTFPVGSSAAPGLAPDGDLDTGFYWIGANNLGLSIAGTKLLDWSSAAMAVTGTLAVSGVTTLADDLVFSETSSQIRTNSSDASDNKSLIISGGGASGTTRGAHIELYGNEHANTGAAVLNSGGTASVSLRVASTDRVVASNTGADLIGACTTTGTQAHTNSADNTCLTVTASHLTYASNMIVAQAYRTANAAYHFFSGVSDSDGTPNTMFLVTANGTVSSDGGTAMSTPADYAEAREWEDGNPNGEDRVGRSVVLIGRKIRLATEDDPEDWIVGVISGNPAVLAGAAWNFWSGKYLRDDFNRQVLDEEGNRVLSPDYKDGDAYKPRMQRREWDAVGMMGVLPLRKGEPTRPSWIYMGEISDAVEEWWVR